MFIRSFWNGFVYNKQVEGRRDKTFQSPRLNKFSADLQWVDVLTQPTPPPAPAAAAAASTAAPSVPHITVQGQYGSGLFVC